MLLKAGRPNLTLRRLQWCAIEMQHLLNKLSINEITLSQDYIAQKSYHDLGLLAPNRHEVDLSNEILNIDFGQGAAKKSKVKVGG